MELSGQLHATQPLFENMGGKKETPIPIEYKAGWAEEARFEKKRKKKKGHNIILRLLAKRVSILRSSNP